MSDKILANWNGEEMPLSEVKVSVLDRAFLFGDAVYEVIRVYHGRPFRLDEHMVRIKSSLDKLSIKFDAIDQLRRNVRTTLTSSGVKNGIVYIQITRGEAPRKHRYPENATPNVLIYVDSLNDPYADTRAKGIPVITYPDIRWGRNDIKQTGLTGNCMAAQAAYEMECTEAILIDNNNFMTEGTHTTIFGVKDGALLVPPESPKVLPSITKMVVLELARANAIPVNETWVADADVYELDELFLAGTTSEIVPIVTVDHRTIGTGKPGPIFTSLHNAFIQLVAREMQGAMI